MKLSKDLQSVYEFFQEAQKLKLVMRHAWNGDEVKQESSAEHTWMLCLMAMTLFHHLEMPVDELRVLKILVIHDVVEVIAGDVPYFIEGERRINKHAAEQAAMQQILSSLSGEVREEFMELWEEFEALETREARVARAIDKYEALFTHAQVGIETWSDGDYAVAFGKKHDPFDADPVIAELKRHIDYVNYEHMKEAGTTDRLDQEYAAEYIN